MVQAGPKPPLRLNSNHRLPKRLREIDFHDAGDVSHSGKYEGIKRGFFPVQLVQKRTDTLLREFAHVCTQTPCLLLRIACLAAKKNQP